MPLARLFLTCIIVSQIMRLRSFKKNQDSPFKASLIAGVHDVKHSQTLYFFFFFEKKKQVQKKSKYIVEKS